jgi:hypothetical protein
VIYFILYCGQEVQDERAKNRNLTSKPQTPNPDLSIQRDQTQGSNMTCEHEWLEKRPFGKVSSSQEEKRKEDRSNNNRGGNMESVIIEKDW